MLARWRTGREIHRMAKRQIAAGMGRLGDGGSGIKKDGDGATGKLPENLIKTF